MILRNCEAASLKDLEKAISEAWNLAYKIHDDANNDVDFEEKFDALFDAVDEISSAFLRFKNAEKDLERIMREEDWDAEERQKAKGK